MQPHQIKGGDAAFKFFSHQLILRYHRVIDSGYLSPLQYIWLPTIAPVVTSLCHKQFPGFWVFYDFLIDNVPPVVDDRPR